jgi:type VI secretion system Hcp family effector
MAYHGYMSIKGSLQGLISAGCSTQDSIGNKCQLGHRDEIMVLAFDHGLTNADNTQRALHRPVYLTKFVDKATRFLPRRWTAASGSNATFSSSAPAPRAFWKSTTR